MTIGFPKEETKHPQDDSDKMNNSRNLTLALDLPVRCISAGVFSPRDENRYPSRVLAAYQLIFVRQGELHIEESGDRFTVTPNQMLFLWPDRQHRGWKVNSMALNYYWAYFTLKEDQSPTPDLESDIPQLRSVARPDHMIALFHRLLEDIDMASCGGGSADATLLSILCEASIERPGVGVAESTATLANRANAIVRTCFHHQLTTSSIADQLACCPDYLGRVYRGVYGVSLVEAIHRRRVQHAKHLLIIGELSLEDIAHHCGFTDSGYFRRIFKRHEGMTPVHFQALHISHTWSPQSMPPGNTSIR